MTSVLGLNRSGVTGATTSTLMFFFLGGGLVLFFGGGAGGTWVHASVWDMCILLVSVTRRFIDS